MKTQVGTWTPRCNVKQQKTAADAKKTTKTQRKFSAGVFSTFSLIGAIVVVLIIP